MANPIFLDPHVFLGRVASGKTLYLAARNGSGTLWHEEWVQRDDGYHCFLHGPCGANYGPLTYEQAYAKVVETQTLLRKMHAQEQVYADRWRMPNPMGAGPANC